MNDALYGQPSKIVLHKITFKLDAYKKYWAKLTDNIVFVLDSNEEGVWTCKVTINFNSIYLHGTHVISGKTTINGRSINIADSVALALRGLASATVELAAAGNSLGLTATPEDAEENACAKECDCDDDEECGDCDTGGPASCDRKTSNNE